MIDSFMMDLDGGGKLGSMNALTTLAMLALITSPVLAQPIPDHERARAAQARGEFVPLQRILADAVQRERGKVIDVELDDDEYEVEILRADGVVIELEYDARTGRLLEREVEDD